MACPSSPADRDQTAREWRIDIQLRILANAVTDATIIIEAGETSGTLVQAQHALKQGRKLFILESNFRNSELKWPRAYEERGAIRVAEYDDIRRHLIPAKTH